MQRICEECIDEAVKDLEKQGYSRESVKVIGTHSEYYSLPCVNSRVGVTNQRETTVAWSRTTGKALCRAIVWDDSRTKNLVSFFEQKLKNFGIDAGGAPKSGLAGVHLLKDLTGLPISTYFSALKLRWMIDHHDSVRDAHDQDDLLFGTVESWIAYVRIVLQPLFRLIHSSGRLCRTLPAALMAVSTSAKSPTHPARSCSISKHLNGNRASSSSSASRSPSFQSSFRRQKYMGISQAGS